MNITDALPIVAGFVAVWVTALINRPGMTAGQKRLIAGGTAAVLGVVSLVVQGTFKELPDATMSVSQLPPSADELLLDNQRR